MRAYLPLLVVRSLFVRFEPLPGKEMEFRDELLRGVETTRAQIGCLDVHVFGAAPGAVRVCDSFRVGE